MAKPIKIVFVGLPGSGKTYLAEKIAYQFGFGSFDLDDLVEEEMEKSIAKIWEVLGEKIFRKMEGKVMSLWILGPQYGVLAAGGGAMNRAESRNYIKKHSISIFVDTPLEVIAQRFADDPSQCLKRPMFNGLTTYDQILEKLQKLDHARREFYMQAKYRVSYNPDEESMYAALVAIVAKSVR
jgi:shikimate kinase